MRRPSLLLVDDDPHVLESMADWLRDQEYEVQTARGQAEAVATLNEVPCEIAIVDIRLEDGDGFEILTHCQQHFPQLAVILMTGYGTADSAVEAIRQGAFDFLTKPLIDAELAMAIERALSQQQVQRENTDLKRQLEERFGIENIVGTDPRMQRIFEVVASVADTRASLLITGESGTGKSLIARATHLLSERRDKPFVEVACGALPETLLESELFGHVAGAFTGANVDKTGKFLQADGGTIFLDEIGTASPAMQVKLLRVLQDLEFEQVGGSKTFKVDTRVVLATNEDLAQAVAEGRFREDLYYRINVITVEMPTLRERPMDIPLLSEYFLNKVCKDTGRKVTGLSDAAASALQRYTWPGNVRQLQNVIERAVLLGKSDVIDVRDLPGDLFASVPTAPAAIGQMTLKEALEEPERQIILEVLKLHNWNRSETADSLGINRTTLYKKMKKLGLGDCPQDAAETMCQ